MIVPILLLLLASGGSRSTAPALPPGPFPFPTRPDPQPKPTPKPKPKGGARLSVRDAQRWLTALGESLSADGLFGPETRAAWQRQAERRGLAVQFDRVDGKTALVSSATADRLSADATAMAKVSPSVRPAPGADPDQADADAAYAAALAAQAAQAEELAKAKHESQPPAAKEKSLTTRTVDVAITQRALVDLGHTLKTDGLYGPNSRAAWRSEAAKRQVDPRYERVDGRRVNVDIKAFMAITHDAAAASSSQDRPAVINRRPPILSAPAPAAVDHDDDDDDDELADDNDDTSTAPPPERSPTPIGYDPAAARREVSALVNHLRRSGKANYDRRWLQRWQRYAGLKPDRVYGGATRGALLHYGGRDVPQPFYEPKETIRYVPPEERS